MKKKILLLLLLLGGFFSFGLVVKADTFETRFYELEVKNSNDITIEEWEFLEQFIDYDNILYDNGDEIEYGFKDTFIDFETIPMYANINQKNAVVGYNVSGDFIRFGFMVLTDDGFYMYSISLVQNEFLSTETLGFNVGDTIVIEYLEALPPPPPFTGFINFIKNLLQDLLKSITDMTMYLINNIWDTNLIDINFVILSDTSIYSGTLNDLLYSVFSIFYVLFAITLVWRVLRKIIRKLFFWDRW